MEIRFIMQAIETRYMGPTNTRGSRIKARCPAGNITVPYDYTLDASDNHRAAAYALINKLNWGDAVFAQGGNFKGDGYVFVNVEGA